MNEQGSPFLYKSLLLASKATPLGWTPGRARERRSAGRKNHPRPGSESGGREIGVAYANGYCLEVFPAIERGDDVHRAQDASRKWLRDVFHLTGGASWNTPKKPKQGAPTANEGELSGQKRKDSFSPLLEDTSRYMPNAICF